MASPDLFYYLNEPLSTEKLKKKPERELMKFKMKCTDEK